MSLKKFVMSGIQDVLENQLGKGKSGNQQPAPSTPPTSNTTNYGQSSGYGQNQNQNQQDMSGYGAPQQPGYGGGYPQQGGYQQQQQGGYPPQQHGGYPPQQQNPGYSANPQTGPGGYPQAGPGYPPQEIGYPQPGGGAGYPGQGAPPPIGFGGAGYPQPGGGAGYPQGPQTGYSPNQGGYPPQGAYPSAPANQGYPPQQQQAYPPQQLQTYGSQNYNTPGAQTSFPARGPAMLGTPSVVALQGFNANTDAEMLRKAMKGLGCNNAKVISVLCGRTNWQRQEISKAFKVMYGKDLLKDLKSELSGDFEDLMLALMEAPAVYDSKQLHKAMDGIGTKESVLIEIMTSRTNQQIADIRIVYRQLYGRDLEKDLVGETSGCFKRLLISLCAGGRDEGNYVDALRANQDARKLYSAGERKLGTDESTFNAILASQNFGQLRMVFDEYEKVSKHPIERAIESEFSGDIRDGLLAVIAVVRNRPAYFAKLLHESMRGLGTRDNDLIRLVVTRCEYDMVDIRNQFQGMYKTSLENMIKGDCSGSYKDGLIALVKGNTQ